MKGTHPPIYYLCYDFARVTKTFKKQNLKPLSQLRHRQGCLRGDCTEMSGELTTGRS